MSKQRGTLPRIAARGEKLIFSSIQTTNMNGWQLCMPFDAKYFEAGIFSPLFVQSCVAFTAANVGPVVFGITAAIHRMLQGLPAHFYNINRGKLLQRIKTIIREGGSAADCEKGQSLSCQRPRAESHSYRTHIQIEPYIKKQTLIPR